LVGQQFNSDLLQDDADLDTARKAFPHVFFALDNPTLRLIFSEHDERANLSKVRSRKWGVFAVGLATVALLLAAANELYIDSGPQVVRIVSAIGAIAGIGSVLIAVMGVMYRKRKIRWLTDRLATERLRQFHFQQFVARGQEIVDAAARPDAVADYLQKRDRDFEKLKAGILSRIEAEFHALVESDDIGDGIYFVKPTPLTSGDPKILEEYFHAYETLRFRRQIDYCNLLLSEKRSIWKNAPARQAKLFAALAMGFIMFILLLDAAIFVGALANTDWINAPYLQFAGMSAAFLALAVRTLEEGFQVESEVARMRHYRQAINRAYSKFRSTNDPAEKMEAMSDMERTAYDEMVTFLKSHNEAEFVM
jgi:hypothetical protein